MFIIIALFILLQVIDLFLYFQNVSISIVGKETLFKVFDEDGTARYLAMIEGEEKRAGQPEASGADAQSPQPPPGGEGPQDPVPSVAMDTE